MLTCLCAFVLTLTLSPLDSARDTIVLTLRLFIIRVSLCLSKLLINSVYVLVEYSNMKHFSSLYKHFLCKKELYSS